MTSPMEIGILFVAILVLFGAKSLPTTLRTVGRWMEQLRRVSDEFKQQIVDVEAEVKRDFDVQAISTGEERPNADELFDDPYHDEYDYDHVDGDEHLEDDAFAAAAEPVEDPLKAYDGLEKPLEDKKDEAPDASS